jgi:SnoaL-like domain
MFVPKLPAIVLDSAVEPADRVSAIDFINRVNWLFDAWDIDAMVEAFLPDSVTHHTHGVSRGQAETRRFFQAQCPHVVPGVSRQALNPIVDPDDDDGVIVRYHNLLVRHSAQATSPRIVAGQVIAGPADMPELWVYSAMTDRLRRTESGWRIFERRVGPTSMSDQVGSAASNRGADPYASQAANW